MHDCFFRGMLAFKFLGRTSFAKNKNAMLDLREYDLDLFRQTSKVMEREAYTIDGLLSLEEIGRLAKDGYEVTVRRPAEQETPARTEIASFQSWLTTLEE